MKPILYSPTETTFAHNGIGVLTDCVSCVVTEERNGAFELEMAYPVDGAFYTFIVVDAIIKAKPSLPARGAWIEINALSKTKVNETCRSPRGERG